MIDDEKEVRFFTYALVIAISIFTISLGVYLVGDNLASIRGGDFPKEHELQYISVFNPHIQQVPFFSFTVLVFIII